MSFKELIANTQYDLGNSSRALSDYIKYSTYNNNIMTTLIRSYSTMDEQSIFVSSNHIHIPTTKLSKHVEHFSGIRYVKTYDRAPSLWYSPCQKHLTRSCSVSKAKDLVMRRIQIANASSAQNFRYAWSSAFYSLMPNTKSHNKMQSCTTKPPCY